MKSHLNSHYKFILGQCVFSRAHLTLHGLLFEGHYCPPLQGHYCCWRPLPLALESGPKQGDHRNHPEIESRVTKMIQLLKQTSRWDNNQRSNRKLLFQSHDKFTIFCLILFYFPPPITYSIHYVWLEKSVYLSCSKCLSAENRFLLHFTAFQSQAARIKTGIRCF